MDYDHVGSHIHRQKLKTERDELRVALRRAERELSVSQPRLIGSIAGRVHLISDMRTVQVAAVVDRS
jgi:hypothetical protein